MPLDIHELAIYLHLARASRQRQRPLVTDRLLVLAAARANRLDLHGVANLCRAKILAHNPNHMVGRFDTVADALEDVDFLSLVVSLDRRYPREKAERMLESLGIDLANERAAYFSDQEYAAALLGAALPEAGDSAGHDAFDDDA